MLTAIKDYLRIVEEPSHIQSARPVQEPFSRDMDERHIYALGEATGDGSFYPPNIFPVSSVERLEGIDGKNTYLVTRSGHKIPVGLPCHVLHQRIYVPDFKKDDMKILDLSAVTGSAAYDVMPKVPGQRMSDGTIYVGRLPSTGKVLFAAPNDAGIGMSFNDAAKHAAQLNEKKAYGHTSWRVPDVEELNLVYSVRHEGKLSGTFNESGQLDAGYYRTSFLSKKDGSSAHSQNFKSGEQSDGYYSHRPMSVRCVYTRN